MSCGFDLLVGRSRKGDGNPLQPACLGNPMDTGAWWATVHGWQKSQTGLNTNNNPTLEHQNIYNKH